MKWPQKQRANPFSIGVRLVVLDARLQQVGSLERGISYARCQSSKFMVRQANHNFILSMSKDGICLPAEGRDFDI
jgi:hypothetical protein